MAQIQARTAKGMRDFLPVDMLKREYVIGVQSKKFSSYTALNPSKHPFSKNTETLTRKIWRRSRRLNLQRQTRAARRSQPCYAL